MFTGEMIASLNAIETSLYNYVSKNEDKLSSMRIRELAHELMYPHQRYYAFVVN